MSKKEAWFCDMCGEQIECTSIGRGPVSEETYKIDTVNIPIFFKLSWDKDRCSKCLYGYLINFVAAMLSRAYNTGALGIEDRPAYLTQEMLADRIKSLFVAEKLRGGNET